LYKFQFEVTTVDIVSNVTIVICDGLCSNLSVNSNAGVVGIWLQFTLTVVLVRNHVGFVVSGTTVFTVSTWVVVNPQKISCNPSSS
jgi:hypothetical protein